MEHELPYVLQLQRRAAEVRCWFDYFAQEKASQWVNGRSDLDPKMMEVLYIFQAIFWEYIPLHKPYIGLT